MQMNYMDEAHATCYVAKDYISKMQLTIKSMSLLSRNGTFSSSINVLNSLRRELIGEVNKLIFSIAKRDPDNLTEEDISEVIRHTAEANALIYDIHDLLYEYDIS